MPGGCWTAADGSCPSGLKRGAPEACTSFHPTRSRRAILILARTGFLERMPLQKQTYKVGSFIFSLMND
jgi:hypothetical protein